MNGESAGLTSHERPAGGVRAEHPSERIVRLTTPPAPAPTLRAAVFAGHALDAEALAALLRSQDVEVTAVGSDVGELVAAVAADPPQVAMLDVELDTGIAIAAALRSAADPIPTLIVPASIDSDGIGRAAAAGVEGVVERTRPPGSIVMALHQVSAGSAVYPAMRGGVTTRLRAAGQLEVLSPRRREVLRLVAEGRSNAEIATQLYISVNTVKFHLRAIFRELGIRNRVEAARRYADIRSLTD
jgi:DNA-binding NarL/FixJ family response regulator